MFERPTLKPPIGKPLGIFARWTRESQSAHHRRKTPGGRDSKRPRCGGPRFELGGKKGFLHRVAEKKKWGKKWGRLHGEKTPNFGAQKKGAVLFFCLGLFFPRNFSPQGGI